MITEAFKNIERLYKAGLLSEALNAFIQEHIDCTRDASGRATSSLSEKGQGQINRYLGARLSTYLGVIRSGVTKKGDRAAPCVRIAVDEMLEAYCAGGLEAVLTLRKWQHDELGRNHKEHMAKLKSEGKV